MRMDEQIKVKFYQLTPSLTTSVGDQTGIMTEK